MGVGRNGLGRVVSAPFVTGGSSYCRRQNDIPLACWIIYAKRLAVCSAERQVRGFLSVWGHD